MAPLRQGTPACPQTFLCVAHSAGLDLSRTCQDSLGPREPGAHSKGLSLWAHLPKRLLFSPVCSSESRHPTPPRPGLVKVHSHGPVGLVSQIAIHAAHGHAPSTLAASTDPKPGDLSQAPLCCGWTPGHRVTVQAAESPAIHGAGLWSPL